ncbi:MAG: GFA family protein [Acidiferrobacterales bacterium]
MATNVDSMHEGGCVCGGVRYRTTGLPQRVAACTCTWCQKRTGSALGLTVYFKESDVAFLQGALRKYRLTSDAERWIETEFCEVCGTTVTFTLELRPGLRAIAGGTFDQPTFWYDLEAFMFARSKPAWLTLPEGLEIHDTAPYHPSVASV